jgi:tRNA pseudouridine38-40 synthase
MTRYAYRLAYDGRPFYGFQRQPDLPTVEGAVFEALSELGVYDGALEESGVRPAPPGYAAAGRTDAGVSAAAQVVTVDGPEWLTPAALNSALPEPVRAVARAPAMGVHATRDAAWRAYVYHLFAPPEDVDDDRARATLASLVGEHDFRNLTADDGDTVRRVFDANCHRRGPVLELRLRAEGFLHEMVRRVATMVDEVAHGTLPVDVNRVLADKPLLGPEGIGPAPPEPLVLVGVGYPDLDFRTDADARDSFRDVFETRRVRALTRERTLSSVLTADRETERKSGSSHE